MSGVEQLDFIDKVFALYLDTETEHDAGDIYAVCGLPARADQEVLTTSDENYYQWNSPLDLDGNGDISKTDLRNRAAQKWLEAVAEFG